jgi:hypothetical protein
VGIAVSKDLAVMAKMMALASVVSLRLPMNI